VDAHIGAPLQGYNTVEVGGQILKIGVWVRRSDVAIFLLSLRNISNIMGQNFSIAISTRTKNKYWDQNFSIAISTCTKNEYSDKGR
jgi:hypothetical protein